VVVRTVQRLAPTLGRLRAERFRGARRSFAELGGDLLQIWQELLDYYRAQGFPRVFYCDARIEKPKSRLREGDNLSFGYCK
jgi:hypothetical protein